MGLQLARSWTSQIGSALVPSINDWQLAEDLVGDGLALSNGYIVARPF
jgi:hypothetical protein